MLSDFHMYCPPCNLTNINVLLRSWELRQLQSLNQPPEKVKPKPELNKQKYVLPSLSGLKTKPWVGGNVRRACIPLGPVKESKVAQVDSAYGLLAEPNKIFLRRTSLP